MSRLGVEMSVVIRPSHVARARALRHAATLAWKPSGLRDRCGRKSEYSAAIRTLCGKLGLGRGPGHNGGLPTYLLKFSSFCMRYSAISPMVLGRCLQGEEQSL